MEAEIDKCCDDHLRSDEQSQFFRYSGLHRLLLQMRSS
jgi:hypothetical protein